MKMRNKKTGDTDFLRYDPAMAAIQAGTHEFVSDDPNETEGVTEASGAPPPDRGKEIREAISGLSATDYTQGGKPKTEAIDAEMPEGSEPVSADERDAIWVSMQSE